MANSDGAIMLSVQVDKETLEKALKGVENGGKKLNGIFGKIGKMLAKGFAVAGAATAVAVSTLVKQSVDAYAECEQLVGGVETLFKGAAQKVVDYASDAFYTAGVSANEYMKQVTAFSASLIRSCAGDTDKAADIANMALVDISDNVNKMGSSMESVTLAYQGFAKQQYMLLDNLKLGYGGTKTEMQRLLKDAQAVTGIKYNIDNLADVYNAIHVIQEQLGITGTTAKEAEATIQGSANMMKAAWQNVIAAVSGGGDIDRAINNLVYSITKYFDNIVPVVQRALVGVGQLIEGIAPMLVQNIAAAVIQAIPGLINAVYAMFVSTAKGILNGIKAIFTGKSGGEAITAQLKTTASGVGAIADNLGAAADNQDALTKGVKGTNKELKKTLAGFDELQILSDSSTSEAAGGTGTTAGGGGGIGGASVEIPEISGETGEEDKVDVNPWVSAIKGLAEILVGTGLIALGIILMIKGNLKWGIGCIIFGLMSIGAGAAELGAAFDASGAKDMLLIITGITGILLLTLGVILLYLGNIPWGIGSLIGGITLLGYTAYELATGGLEAEQIMSVLSTLLAFLGGALLAIGVFLCFMSVYPMGIACIIAGVAALVGSGVAASKSDGKEVSDWLTTLLVVVSGFLIVLGVLLLIFGGFSPLGIGLIIAGAVVLTVALVNRTDTIPQEVKNWINGIFAIASVACLVIGIIMMCAGQFTPLSIGLVIAGAVGLATEIAVNWDWLKEKLQGEIGEITAIASTALLALGIIILVASGGAALVLGLSLICAGAVGLATAVTANWDGIVEKIKNVWNKVKEFWDEHIKQIFTKDWWLELAKKCGNGLISGFEGAVNGIIGLFEKMINFIVKGLNKISFDVPDWVPGVGGKTFGFDLREVNLGRVSIPRLAQGAVIPANREFLAVLGDQKRGTNIEAPAELIKQMAMEAISEMGITGTQNQQIIKEEHYNLNQTELMTIMYKLVRGGERINGTSLVNQGGY